MQYCKFIDETNQLWFYRQKIIINNCVRNIIAICMQLPNFFGNSHFILQCCQLVLSKTRSHIKLQEVETIFILKTWLMVQKTWPVVIMSIVLMLEIQIIFFVYAVCKCKGNSSLNIDFCQFPILIYRLKECSSNLKTIFERKLLSEWYVMFLNIVDYYTCRNDKSVIKTMNTIIEEAEKNIELIKDVHLYV